jgi:ribosome modulation factor
MNDGTTHDDNSAPDEPRQSPSPADLLGPRETLTAQDQGHAAALAGEHVSTCPWKAATTPREITLREMWIRGHSAGRTDLRTARTSEQ